MNAHEFALFDTPIGACGVVWGTHGIARLQLPESNTDSTRARLLERFPEARAGQPPAIVARALDAIRRLLSGQPSDLSGIELDMTGVPPFHRQVYQMARGIGPGQTLSYGDVARALGAPGAARAVGQALGKNPFAIIVPCHRVLAAGGKIGGFSANGGTCTKLRLLALEAAGADGQRTGFAFDPQAALGHLGASDRVLGRLIAEVGPFRLTLQQTPSVFAALSEAIVHQQLSTRAARTIFGRFRALFPGAEELEADAVLAEPEERLRSAGLSRSKILALRDLARRTSAGELPTLAEVRGMSDEAIVERLTVVRGIGRWTAEMLLIFRLGRPDVLPVDDYGVRKGFAKAYRKREVPAPAAVERHGERWRPYRSVASWYLWRALDPPA